jgi:mersacidin/lichenicidin family type 2 lantibiotic
MNKELIIRAWKDPAFRASLSSEERAALPESPSGQPMTELDDSELRNVSGGIPPETAAIICCPTMRPRCTAGRRCVDF